MKIIGMATMPERISTLELVISNLVKQVDHIELALNDFKEIPKFLSKYPNVLPNLTTNIKGDANKFLNISKYTNDYYFSCDDDLLYPENYIQTFVDAIDKNKCLITIHGSVIPPTKIKSYYRGRTMKSHCLRKSEQHTVHIPGSGVSGFHTSFLKIDYLNGFPVKNMADIFLGIQCQQQNVKCISIKHEDGWIKGEVNEGRPTIWSTHKNNDTAQTEYVNSINWKNI